MKEVLSPIAFGIFVGITAIQCRYEGTARFALTVAGGVALWISMYLFTRIIHEKRSR